MAHKFPYKWTLNNANFTKDKGRVFSCFACGGGSTMGYKLAGFDVIGCNEIDPRMNNVYVANHHPKYNFLCDIREMTKAEDLPEELYNLDILDGSPPCSSFSMAGVRENGWGKEKNFREGQTKQVLDTLFFDFIELAKKLQPKIVIAENVKGILLGSATKYIKKIYSDFEDSGYKICHALLDSSKMGVPQIRQRVFFIAIRNDLFQYIPKIENLFDSEPLINLDFDEEPIILSEFTDYKGRPTLGEYLKLWKEHKSGEHSLSAACSRIKGKDSYFCEAIVYQNEVCCTLTSQGKIHHHDKPVHLSEQEIRCVSTFPQDYDFGAEKPAYICGMSVPPVMMAQVASRVYEQWLNKIPKANNIPIIN